ncbi:MAG: PDZ domain-containing protein [Gemmatimonadota bacterium]
MRRSGLVMALVLAAQGPAAAPLAAQGAAQGAAACQPGERYEVDFGIQGLSARQMEFSVRQVDGVSARSVSFGSEPTVTAVRADGPAEGRLRPGDVIVAIDGRLITTRAAGERWSTVAAGERVVLTVRRSGREEAVRLTTGERCARPTPAPPAPAAGSPPGTPRAAAPPAVGAVAAGRGASASPGVRFRPGAPLALAAPPPPPAPSVLPDGWFGFGISCSDCQLSTGPGGEGPAFRFSVPPEVQSVEPGTPAAAAGLQSGDLLLAIDGVALTSEAGGRAFARVEPGQNVRFRIRRDARALDVTMRAVAREGREAPAAQAFSVGRAATPLPTRAFADQARPPASTSVTAGRASSVTAAPTVSRTLRYSGTVGNVVVEVRGSPSVVVSEVRPGGDVIIRVGQTEIRVTAPPGGG